MAGGACRRNGAVDKVWKVRMRGLKVRSAL
jgi:hypothetical protein